MEKEAVEEHTEEINEETAALVGEKVAEDVNVSNAPKVVASNETKGKSAEKKTKKNIFSAISGVISGGSDLPFPANLIAIALGVATVAGLLASFGVFSGGGGAAAKTTAQLSETAEADNKTADKKQEQYTKNKESYTNFQQAYKKYDSTGEGLEDLQAAALEVAEAYDVAGGKALALAGDFEELSKRVQDKRV
jgi:hypothetical protein